MSLKTERSKNCRNNSVIVIEGSPCSGKTSLAKRLAKDLNIKLVKELLFKIKPNDKRRINFYINDLLKSLKNDNETTVIDRYFLSTVAFEEAFRKTYGQKKLIADTYDRQHFCALKLYPFFLQRSILKYPNIVLYLKISPLESLRRRKMKEKVNYRNPWFDIRFLEAFQGYCVTKIRFWYKVEPIIINGSLTMKEIIAILKKKLDNYYKFIS
ncbi:hypothetical protein COS31_00435 [Candidatus Roizmanbacteria bacterium CG02_land_8_20_14_3_00_36_15]|nr:MAG: hypothetical protein COS31_00435 [Candidatus Roizmanbacteria bacterium CG02_land_8_20_14_3_00_36_15]PJA53609.1 MAG: hypothetical protein CO166_01250 [Candidatus Roizmanbacteria bacterium CG_4_9_14_3_um_filter_36_11]